jgi:S-adenosylmethionine uptake transporter
VAPFEYTELPMAVFWGWLIWGELPGARASAGIVLIMGAGLYVFLREKQRSRPVSSRRAFRRW